MYGNIAIDGIYDIDFKPKESLTTNNVSTISEINMNQKIANKNQTTTKKNGTKKIKTDHRHTFLFAAFR